LIHEARQLYADEDFGFDLRDTVYALDATIIDLCLSIFPWAWFRTTKSAIKLHTLIDLTGNIPSFIWITHAKLHEVNILDQLVPEPSAIYVMDRGYLDFERLYRLHQCSSFFIVRTKANTGLRRIYSKTIDKSVGIRYDQVVVPIVIYSRKAYPEKFRRVKFIDAEQERRLTFITNQFTLPALTITELYRCRWQVELFFKWIK
jgi:IS4 transposase